MNMHETLKTFVTDHLTESHIQMQGSIYYHLHPVH